ncbi:MAG: hypothetical protein MUE97_04380, partial [Phycisphaerales bacterium]|nr:hypothetical protein [Phycisphaerales bacterium]
PTNSPPPHLQPHRAERVSGGLYCPRVTLQCGRQADAPSSAFGLLNAGLGTFSRKAGEGQQHIGHTRIAPPPSPAPREKVPHAASSRMKADEGASRALIEPHRPSHW